jgi:hypothetical protein
MGYNMDKTIKILGYGFIIWLVPFIASLLIYPIKSFANPLFESIMPVIITMAVVIFSVVYFRGVNENFFKEGIVIGLVWFLLSIIIDLIFFIPASPMQMSFANYMMDIGITYLIIPVVTIGFGYIIHYNHIKKKTH